MGVKVQDATVLGVEVIGGAPRVANMSKGTLDILAEQILKAINKEKETKR